MQRSTRRAGLAATAAIAATAALAGPAAARPICDIDAGGGCPTPQQSGDGTALGTVNVARGYTLTVRRRPNSAARRVRSVADGQTVHIVCQTTGQETTGRFGTTRIWDKLARGGFVSDAYIYTGSDRRVARDCRRGTPAPPVHHPGRPDSVQLRNDYPFKAASPNDVDRWNFYKRECTSFVAYRLNKVMQFSNLMRGGHFGNAENWDDNARAIGMKVNRRPTVGSVMVRNSGTFGHVAIVARVRRGRILVEQYNAGGTHTYSREWLAKTSVMTFIHP